MLSQNLLKIDIDDESQHAAVAKDKSILTSSVGISGKGSQWPSNQRSIRDLFHFIIGY